MENNEINILLSEDDIKNKIKEIGKIITEDYKDKNLYVLSLLRGSFIFTADLVRVIDTKVKVGFMTTSSYGHSETSQGNIKVINDIPDDIEGYDVLIVDDIIDTGLYKRQVIDYVKERKANSIKVCTLLDKPSRRQVSLSPDYVCFEIEDVFVVGYGLNYGDYYRNIPYVFNWKK